MALLKLSAPWEIYYKELNELFKNDKEIHIVYDRENQVIDMYVENQAKADALTELIPAELQFGSISLEVVITPANKCNNRRSAGDIFRDAFYDNPVVTKIVTIDIMTNPITYVIFEKKVIQYYNDNLGDANGVCSTLYQDIATRVLNDIDGVYYCTDVTDSSFTISYDGYKAATISPGY